ncbi:MAG: peptide/nickel transport system substrate-binding protein [Yoonia sp.]|jgi:peptide/nickel transport system substrate-binding protein
MNNYFARFEFKGLCVAAALSLAAVQPAYAQDIKNPGLLVHAADDEPTSLDPAQVEPGEGGETVILQVYDRLLDIGPDSPDLIPSLALEVPTVENGLISDDGLTYTFNLRQGVMFHDGTALTADDVKYSWDRAIEMDLPEGNSGVLADYLAGTAVVDDYTFQATLNEASASFLNSAVIAMVASIVSQDAVEANGGIEAGVPNVFMSGNAVGTGPYKFTVWNRNENLQLEVFDDYWGENAKLDVRIEIGGDPDVRVLGLRAGEFDTIETDPSFIADLEGVEGVTVYKKGLLLEPLHIGMNLNIPEGSLPPEDTIPEDFFHDVRVRQAFNYAFDYQAFLNGPLAGYGEFNPHYIPIGIFGYDPEMPTYNMQDAAKAEELFRAAGYWDDGFTISVITEEGNLFALMCLVMKDSLESLNPKFRVNVLAVAESVFDDAHASDPLEYAMWAKNADPAADPNAYLQAYAHPDGDWGQVHGFANGYADPDAIGAMIDAAAVELDAAARAQMYIEIADVLYDEPMWLIGAQEGVVAGHRDWVKGFTMQPLWPRPGFKFALFDK